jgi:hypothetical protein
MDLHTRWFVPRWRTGSGQVNGRPSAEQAAQRRKGVGCMVVTLVVLGCAWILAEVFSDDTSDQGFVDDDTSLYSSSGSYHGAPIPMFTPAESQRLAEGLARAEQTYDVCFGWRLTDGSTGRVQVGSSAGPGIAADTCSQRWVEVRIVVAYTSDSDPTGDAADIDVQAAPDWNWDSPLTTSDFTALGITASALVDDPVSVTGHAAMALPLLLVEHGVLPPADADAQAPSAPPATPLPPADESGFPGSVVLLVVLGLAALTAFGIGIWGPGRRGGNSGPDLSGGGPGGPPPANPPTSGPGGHTGTPFPPAGQGPAQSNLTWHPPAHPGPVQPGSVPPGPHRPGHYGAGPPPVPPGPPHLPGQTGGPGQAWPGPPPQPPR